MLDRRKIGSWRARTLAASLSRAATSVGTWYGPRAEVVREITSGGGGAVREDCNSERVPTASEGLLGRGSCGGCRHRVCHEILPGVALILLPLTSHGLYRSTCSRQPVSKLRPPIWQIKFGTHLAATFDEGKSGSALRLSLITSQQLWPRLAKSIPLRFRLSDQDCPIKPHGTG